MPIIGGGTEDFGGPATVVCNGGPVTGGGPTAGPVGGALAGPSMISLSVLVLITEDNPHSDAPLDFVVGFDSTLVPIEEKPVILMSTHNNIKH